MKPERSQQNLEGGQAVGVTVNSVRGETSVQTDQRKGVFIDQSSVQGMVVGNNFGTIIANIYGVEPNAKHHRDRMLARVRHYWIDGVLDSALANLGSLDLTVTLVPEAVTPSAPYGIDLASTVTQSAGVSSTQISTIFKEYQHQLLILGPAGSGKTILLLKLARDLLAQAEQNPEAPIPVVLNLASWAHTRQSLAQWLRTELREQYDVPSAVSRVWLEKSQMALLLDGLDEVGANRRAACIDAINEFRRISAPTFMLVCCRQDAYAELQHPLTLEGALLLQLLTPQQVIGFFEHADHELQAIGQAVCDNPTLSEFARTPLLLGTIVLACARSPADIAHPLGDTTESMRRLFAMYVTRMLEPQSNYRIYGVKRHIALEHPPAADYAAQDIRHWLVWLAQLLRRRGETIFYIERLQADALPRRMRGWYVLLVALLAGFLVGPFVTLLILVLGLETEVSWVVGICVGLGAALGAALGGAVGPGRAADWDWRQRVRWSGLLGLLVGILFGFLAGIDGGWLVGVGAALTAGSISTLSFELCYRVAAPFGIAPASGLSIGLGIGIGTAATVGLLNLLIPGQTLADAFRWALIVLRPGVIIGLSALFVASLSGQVRSAETLHWLWRPGLLVGAVAGLFFGVRAYVLTGWDAALMWGVREAVLFGLVAGLSGREVEVRTVPNQGIRLSLRNALWGLPAGIGTWLGLALPAAFWLGGLGAGLAWALRAGLTVLMAWALRSGLLACLQHGLLRLLLERSGAMPRTYAHFLDAATARLLLRRVGGGYMFVHRMLLDYFANQEGTTSR